MFAALLCFITVEEEEEEDDEVKLSVPACPEVVDKVSVELLSAPVLQLEDAEVRHRYIVSTSLAIPSTEGLTPRGFVLSIK